MTSEAKCSEGMDDVPELMPSSYMRFIPAYPTRKQMKAIVSGIRGPLESTMRTQIGPDT